MALRRSKRAKTVPSRTFDANDLLKENTESLGLVGLKHVKSSSGIDVRNLSPENEAVVGYMNKHTPDGEVFLQVSNLRFRIKPGTYNKWCMSASSLFGQPKPGSSDHKFHHQNVTVTIFESGTVMVQGCRSVEWTVNNFSRWINCIYSNSLSPATLEGTVTMNSIDIVNTPVSHTARSIPPRNLSVRMKPVTPSAPPLSESMQVKVQVPPRVKLPMKPVTPTAPPLTVSMMSTEADPRLTPSAPPFIPKVTPTSTDASYQEGESQWFSMSEDTAPVAGSLHTHYVSVLNVSMQGSSENMVTSTPNIPRCRILRKTEEKPTTNISTQTVEETSEKDEQIKELQAQIKELKKEISQQKTAFKKLEKLKDDAILKAQLDPQNREQTQIFRTEVQITPRSVTTEPKLRVVLDSEADQDLAAKRGIPCTVDTAHPDSVNTSNDESCEQHFTALENLNDYTSVDSDISLEEVLATNVTTQSTPQTTTTTGKELPTQNPKIKRLIIPPSDCNPPTSPHAVHHEAGKLAGSPLWFKGRGRHKQNKVLSNLHHCPVSVFGEEFKSREHGYQWAKAVYHGHHEKAEAIFNADTASAAMELGQKIITCQAWECEVKLDKMREIQMAAVSSCKNLREKLLSSDDRPIKERTTHHTWGALQGGQNKMGEFHVEMRHLLRTNQIDIIESKCNTQSQNSKKTTQTEKDALKEGGTQKEKDTRRESGSDKDEDARREGSERNSKDNQTQQSTSRTPKRGRRPQKGLLFGDSMTKNVHPEVYGGDFNTVTVSGGRLCPRPNSNDNHTNMNKRLMAAMTGEEKHVGLHIGTNDSVGCDIDLFESRYRSLVHTAQSGGAQVYCSGIYHRGDLSNYDARFARNALIDELNEVIMSIADELGCVYLDNCAAVQSSAHRPNLSILTNPPRGVKYLHLNEAAKLDLKYRLEDQVCNVQQRAFPTPPRPSKHAGRSSRNTRNRYRGKTHSHSYPYSRDDEYGYSRFHGGDYMSGSGDQYYPRYVPSRRFY